MERSEILRLILELRNTKGISPEKLAFLKAMSSRQAGGNAQEMMASLMSISNSAQKQGVAFSDSERDLMLELLLNNLSPEEGKKARSMIQMMKRMKH